MSIVRVPFGISAAALRARQLGLVMAISDADWTDEKRPSAAPAALWKPAMTVISAGSVPLPPRSALSVATCWPASISAPQPGVVIQVDDLSCPAGAVGRTASEVVLTAVDGGAVRGAQDQASRPPGRRFCGQRTGRR